jgi:hypothetical protein
VGAGTPCTLRANCAKLCTTLSKSPKTYGLHARYFPRPVQWQLECDYLHKLSDEDKAYLSQFNDEFHGAAFAEDKPIHNTVELRRERYRAKNHANADAYGLAAAGRRLDYMDDELAGKLSDRNERDQSPLPRYLESDEYREALAEFREHLPKNNKNKTVITPELTKAQRRLKKAKR